VTVGTSSGDIAVFGWDWFGDCNDRIVGHPEGVECMLKYSEDVLVTGGEDGWIRVVGVYPHSINLFHRHADDMDDCYAVTGLAMSHDKRVLGSISHDCSINFYDLTEIAEQIDDADQGEKLELAEAEAYKPLKHEMGQKGGNKEKKQQRIMEKKKKIDFFEDI
jgi:WD40 repeat protein